MKIRLCSLRKHVWRLLRGGKREQCQVCKTVFPCRTLCGHLDCRLERGDALPDWITEVA